MADRVSGAARGDRSGRPVHRLSPFPADNGRCLRHRHTGTGAADRIQWPDFAGARRVLRDRGLYDGDPHDGVERAVLADAAGVGFLVGLPALRLGGLYLALTTFALAVSIPQILKYKAIEDWTGGVQGLVIDKPEAPFGLGLSPDQWLYLFTGGVAVVLYIIAWNIVRGRV